MKHTLKWSLSDPLSEKKNFFFFCYVCVYCARNPGPQASLIQTEPHPQPNHIPFLNLGFTHSQTGISASDFETTKSLDEIRTFQSSTLSKAQLILLPLLRKRGHWKFRKQGAYAKRLTSQILNHWFSTRPVPRSDCIPLVVLPWGHLEWEPCPVRSRIKDAQPQWAFERMTSEVQQVLTQAWSGHPSDRPHTTHTKKESWPRASDTMCPLQSHYLTHEN